MRIELIICMILILIVMNAFSAFSGTVNLPQTGQTKCYDTAGTEIPCPGTGQDGANLAGVAWPEPRFTVNGDCVTDSFTGLMWARNTNLPNGNMSWYQAIYYVAAMNCGNLSQSKYIHQFKKERCSNEAI